jgi:hypothetical protein
MVDCEICDRSHAPSHPHIANIEGDDPIDDAPAPGPSKEISSGSRPVARAPLPDWLKDKPGSQAIRPTTGTADQVDPTKLCQVCGEPWAPKHACKGAESPGTKKKVTPYHMRKYQKCDVCGLTKRINHKCKGEQQADPPVETKKPCEVCEALGRLCAFHGGVWSDYDTPKGGEQVALQLPESVPVTMPAPVEQDVELAAMGVSNRFTIYRGKSLRLTGRLGGLSSNMNTTLQPCPYNRT